MFAGTSSVTFVRSVRYVLFFLIGHIDLSGYPLWQVFCSEDDWKKKKETSSCVPMRLVYVHKTYSRNLGSIVKIAIGKAYVAT